MIITLTPTHARDYPTAKAALQAWLSGQLFALQPSGVYMDIQDLPLLREHNNIEAIHIKFKHQTRTLVIPIPAKPKALP